MKLKRIFAAFAALAMTASILPSAFAATAGINIDFTSTAFDEFKALGTNKPTNEVKTGVYGKAADDKSMAIVSSEAYTGSTAARAYKSDVALTKSGSRLSFKIAAEDKNSIKAVSFGTGTTAPSTLLFSMDTDGKMYFMGSEICSYTTERWYQIDIEFASTGAYTVYVDGGATAKVSGTVTSGMDAIFGTDSADSENRNLFYLMKGKTSGTKSVMYVDDFETETTDTTSAASVSEQRMLGFSYSGSGTLSNETMTLSNIPSGMTKADFVADLTLTKGSVSVQSNGHAVDDDEPLEHGTTIKFSSLDGKTVLTYTVDSLNLVFNAPNGTTTRELTQQISVTFDGTATRVDFYVNGSLTAEQYTAPYEYTVEHTAGGDYTVKARVVLPSGTTAWTPERTYTFQENAVPTVSVTGVTNNQGVSQSDSVSLNITASDADSGLTKVELYFDGSKVAEKSATSPYPTSLSLDEACVKSGLSLGQHTVYAKAYDADGASATSATVTFTVITTYTTDIDYADFESGPSASWSEYQTTNLSIIDDPTRPDNKVLAYEDGTGQSLYMHGAVNASGTVYWETEFMTQDVNAASYFVLREPDGMQNDVFEVYIQSGMFDGSYAISANTWYKVRITANIKSGKASVYISGDNGINWTKTRDADISALGSIGTVRIYVNNQGKTSNYKFYIDNIKLYAIGESAYLTSTDYLLSNGATALSGGKVSPEAKTIKLNYNTPVGSYGIEKSNFSIKDENGKAYTQFDVTAADTAVTITLNGSLLSQTKYTVTISGLEDAIAQGTPSKIEFTTDTAAFDVTASKNYVNGTETSSLSGVRTGDTLKTIVDIKNSTGSPIATKMIYVIYSGDKLIGISEKVYTVGTAATSIDSQNTTVTGTVDDTVTTEVYFWSSLDGTPTIQMDSVK